MRSVFVRTLSTTTRSLALVCLHITISLLVVAVTVALTGTLALKPIALLDPMTPAIGTVLGTAGSIAGFVAGGLVFTTLFGAPLTREQANGQIITVIASPVGARRAWIARSLALWIISTIGALISAGVAVIALHQIWARAYPWGQLSNAYLLTMVLLIPLLLLGMALLLNGVGVTAGAVPATVAANIIYIGITTTTGRLAGAGLSPAWYAGVFGIFAGALLLAGTAVAFFVTRERMVVACQ